MTTITTKNHIATKNIPKKIYSLSEYLEREARNTYKHEFYNGQIIKMPGGNARHSEIAMNVGYAIKREVKTLPTRFRVYNSDSKIFIESENKVIYPDALVICDIPIYWNNREDLIINPLLIVEMASASTRAYDRGEKFLLYERLPSFKEYFLIEQNKPYVESWFREMPNVWRKNKLEEASQTIFLASLGITLSLSDIYENIDF